MEFQIHLHSVDEVLKFVSLATARPYAVQVRDDSHTVNGKSFMEMFCLDLNSHLTVSADGSQDQVQQLMLDADRFLVK